jgi:lysyl-tRNA synthetase class 2
VDVAGLRARATVLRAMRTFFADRRYLEVPTPALVPSAAMEENLHPIPAGGGFLRTSPEFALKRALAAGLGRIYEIGPCFRDHERGAWHRREFLMCEWYRVGALPEDVMDEIDALVAACAAALSVPDPGPFARVTVRAAFASHAGVDLATATAADLSDVDESWDDAFVRRFVTDVEPRLEGAVILRDWPASQAALSRVRTDGEWPAAERFEVYLRGVELANAFHELTDPEEQVRRCRSSNAARAAAGLPENPLDPAFLEAVGRMPRATGIALGVDRLVAALCGWDGIAPGRLE